MRGGGNDPIARKDEMITAFRENKPWPSATARGHVFLNDATKTFHC